MDVLVGEVGSSTANEHGGVETNTKAGVVLLGDADGRRVGGLGGSFTGLIEKYCQTRRSSYWGEKDPAELPVLQVGAESRGARTYLSLQRSDLQRAQDLTGLVTVSDVLESLRAILTTDIEKDFLTTTMSESHVSYCNLFVYTARPIAAIK